MNNDEPASPSFFSVRSSSAPMQQIEIFQQNRGRIRRAVEGLSAEELTWIPPGFRNNILWNLGHIVAIQQIFHYRLAGQPLRVSEVLVANFKTGSSPADWRETPDAAEAIGLLEELGVALEEDYRAGRLGSYQPYTTASGIHVADIESAIAFNTFHEGMHLGIIQCMRRLWAGRGAA